MRATWLAVIVYMSGVAWAQPSATTAPAVAPAPPMDRAALEPMYRRELGPLFRPDQVDALYRAHQLLEQYFARPEQRKLILAELRKSPVDPNILGRIARIRMHWPALAPGVYYVNERVGPNNAHYFLGVPRAYDRAKPWPLVIKLPTADAFVTNPPPDADQVRSIYTAWMSDALWRHPDTVVIMPLLNLDELWGPSYPGMYSVIAPMWHAAEQVNIDPARVYLWGHSMSGHAAWNLALHFTTYFAGFNALAGGCGAEWQRLRLMNLRPVLPVVWHDRKDEVIKVESSRRPVRALRGLKIGVEYDETEGIGHVPTAEVIARADERLRGRTRELYPKWITLQSNRMDTMFNRLDWVQVYQPLRPGEEKRQYFRRGSGYMKTQPNSWKVDAKIENNRITATTTNVQSLRFYLNDQMMDFSRPVTVVVNNRGRFEGVLRPNIEEMLKDQLVLGRGWRYFTAVVDVDLAPPGKPTTQP